MQIKIPKLTLDILAKIIYDAAKLSNHVAAVGVVGSFSTDRQKPDSDVDLLVKIDESSNFQDVIESFGGYVKHILDYQFNKRLDIIRYDLVADYENHETNAWFCQDGFKQMLGEVRWIYER